MKKNSNTDILLSFLNVSGIVINALTHCLTESTQQPYEVDAIVIPILQMEKLEPGGAEWCVCGERARLWQRQGLNHDTGDSENSGDTRGILTGWKCPE